jgi:hypothetical protein
MATKPKSIPRAGYEWIQMSGGSWSQRKKKAAPAVPGRGSSYVQARYDENLAYKSGEGMKSSLKQARPSATSSSSAPTLSSNKGMNKYRPMISPSSVSKPDKPKPSIKPTSTPSSGSKTKPKITGKAVSQSDTMWNPAVGKKKGFVSLKSSPTKKYTGRIKIVEKGSTKTNAKGIASYSKGRNALRKRNQ